MEGQLTLFGTVENVKEPEEARDEKRHSPKIIRPQKLWGLTPGKTCKTCKHCVRFRQSKAWYKCEIWKKTHSIATDIRLKWPACGRYEEETADE